jgi:hypothetical protein
LGYVGKIREGVGRVLGKETAYGCVLVESFVVVDYPGWSGVSATKNGVEWSAAFTYYDTVGCFNKVFIGLFVRAA